MTEKQNDEQKEEVSDLLLKLSEGLSNHTKTASRYWLALAFVSVLTITSSFSGSASMEELNNTLPFGLGDVDKSRFYPFSIVLISLLVIAFGAAQAQMIRARMLANTVLREECKNTKLLGGVDLRDVFDAITASSINRTVPLAQLILGRHQFYPSKHKQPKIRKFVAVFYQGVLKIVTYFVIYFLPAYGLFISFISGGLIDTSVSAVGIPLFFLWVVSFVAIIILIQLFLLEIDYARSALKRIYADQVD